MIVDSIGNWKLYFAGAPWQEVAGFLASLTPDTAEGSYPIRGEEIFAKVMSYDTRGYREASFEAHRDYLDIQAVLAGAEGIAWHLAGSLPVRDPYDPQSDVEFYLTPPSAPARVDVFPGTFVALFPHDAHMPQLQVEGMPGRVKKVVVKIRTSLYPGPRA